MPPGAAGPGHRTQPGRRLSAAAAATAGALAAPGTTPAARRAAGAAPGRPRCGAGPAAAGGRRPRRGGGLAGGPALGAGPAAGPRCPATGPAGIRHGSSWSGPLSGGTAITVLAAAAWLLWALFTAAVIAEVTAAARGRPVPRLPAIAPVQALAATLAGTAVLTALHLPRSDSLGPPSTRTRRSPPPSRPPPRSCPGAAPAADGSGRAARPGHPGSGGRTTACTPSGSATPCGTWPAPTCAAGNAGTRSTTSTAAGRSPAGAP